MSGLGDNLSLYGAIQGYEVIFTDEDDDAQYKYYLFMDRNSDLYLRRIEKISDTVKSHKFFKLPSGSVPATVWAARAGYSYDYPYPVFKDFQ